MVFKWGKIVVFEYAKIWKSFLKTFRIDRVPYAYNPKTNEAVQKDYEFKYSPGYTVSH